MSQTSNATRVEQVFFSDFERQRRLRMKLIGPQSLSCFRTLGVVSRNGASPPAITTLSRCTPWMASYEAFSICR